MNEVRSVFSSGSKAVQAVAILALYVNLKPDWLVGWPGPTTHCTSPQPEAVHCSQYLPTTAATPTRITHDTAEPFARLPPIICTSASS